MEVDVFGMTPEVRFDNKRKEMKKRYVRFVPSFCCGGCAGRAKKRNTDVATADETVHKDCQPERACVEHRDCSSRKEKESVVWGRGNFFC